MIYNAKMEQLNTLDRDHGECAFDHLSPIFLRECLELKSPKDQVAAMAKIFHPPPSGVPVKHIVDW